MEMFIFFMGGVWVGIIAYAIKSNNVKRFILLTMVITPLNLYYLMECLNYFLLYYLL